MRLLALLLPVFALAVVGAVGAVVFVAGDEGSSSRPAATASPTATAQPETPVATRPRLEPGQTVCQGVLHLPEPGAARTFPAIYTQKREAAGIAIVGGAAVPPEAFDIAIETVQVMFDDPELVAPLIEQGAYIVIAEPGQGILDLPEFACLEDGPTADRVAHACGIADRADYPVVTVNTDDLLGEASGPCAGLNILFHELGHLVQGWALSPPDYFDVKQYYAEALAAGKYRGAYAATNPNEYFAEATQAYFLSADLNGRLDRAWLRRYDPQLFRLLERVYGE